MEEDHPWHEPRVKATGHDCAVVSTLHPFPPNSHCLLEPQSLPGAANAAPIHHNSPPHRTEMAAVLQQAFAATPFRLTPDQLEADFDDLELGNTYHKPTSYGAVNRICLSSISDDTTDDDSFYDESVEDDSDDRKATHTRNILSSSDNDKSETLPLLTASRPHRAPRLFRWYLFSLEEHPLPTKSVTSGALAAFSDVVAQAAAGCVHLRPRRMASLALVGACLTAPLFHFLYERMERAIPARKGIRNVALQVAIDQALAWPLWLAAFYPLMALLEGSSLKSLEVAFKDYFPRALMLAWVVFAPAKAAAAALLPRSLRVLAVNIVGVGFTAFLSSGLRSTG